jgi:pyroglutamyl-peptidase
MTRILITAFEPYDIWEENSSWLALAEYTKDLPTFAKIVTRLYPVNFQQMRERLTRDLAADFDYALHLGQAPGSTAIRLEAIAINIGGSSKDPAESFHPLASDGPVAYQSALPLPKWTQQLREAGIPATVSYHAGTYLCNATLYMSHYLAEQRQLRTQATFVHLPLDTSQACRHTTKDSNEIGSLPTAMAVTALRLLVADLVKQGPIASPMLA